MEKLTSILLRCMLFILIGIPNVSAQTTSLTATSWPRVINATAGFSFDFPSTFKKYDTLNITGYFIEIDSVQLEVHYVNTTSNRPAVARTSIAPNIRADTLAQFVPMLLQATSGQLVSHQIVTHNAGLVKGKQVQITYISEDNHATTMYSRFYWFNNKLLTFTATAKNNRAALLATYQSRLFNSINFP